MPPSQWSGAEPAPELLAAFVRPNDPAIDQTLRVAATKLEAAGRSTSLDGYVSGSKAGVWEMAEGIWAAAVELRNPRGQPLGQPFIYDIQRDSSSEQRSPPALPWNPCYYLSTLPRKTPRSDLSPTPLDRETLGVHLESIGRR